MLVLGATALMLASPNSGCRTPKHEGINMGSRPPITESVDAKRERRPIDVHTLVPVREPETDTKENPRIFKLSPRKPVKITPFR